MQKEQTPVTVLKDFDGFNANIVEVINRIVQTGGRRNRKGHSQIPRRSVSYNGQVYDVFRLPQSYGVEHGDCISIS